MYYKFKKSTCTNITFFSRVKLYYLINLNILLIYFYSHIHSKIEKLLPTILYYKKSITVGTIFFFQKSILK